MLKSMLMAKSMLNGKINVKWQNQYLMAKSMLNGKINI
jgi:hypothetical protein